MQFDILVPNYSEGEAIFKNETNLSLNYYRKQIKLKIYFKNVLYHIKFELLTSVFWVKYYSFF